MEKRQRRQTTERIGEPLNCGFGKVYLERRNGSPFLSARAYIQGKHKVWTTGERDEKKAAVLAPEQFLDYADTHLQREVSAGQREQYHIKWKVLKKVLKKHFERDGQPVRRRPSSPDCNTGSCSTCCGREKRTGLEPEH